MSRGCSQPESSCNRSSARSFPARSGRGHPPRDMSSSEDGPCLSEI
eukprot:gene26081-biopygen13679